MRQVIKSDSGWEKSDFIRLKRKRKFQNREQRGKSTTATKKLNILIKFVIFVKFLILYISVSLTSEVFFVFAEFYFYYYFYLK